MAAKSFHAQDMVMDGWIKKSFHVRLLLAMLSLCWILVGAVMVFQYQREKEFKTILLDMSLQSINNRIIRNMRSGITPDSVLRDIESPVEELRVTVIDKYGKVIFDNNDKTPFPSTNHNNRPEVLEARKNGTGHAVTRLSESDDVSYFYSARLGDNGLVVRSAAPYTHSLSDYLKADSTILWIMAAITILMSAVAFIVVRRISINIKRLNLFAGKAERGEYIYDEVAFPDDELGSIAAHIVKLYVQRDMQHKEAIKLEKEKNRLEKQLSNNINHELKTPVASILVCLDLLYDHPELPDSKKQTFIDRIRDNAHRLDSLLKDVASITRMEEGKKMIEMSEISLSPVISGIVNEAKMRTDIVFEVDVPDLKITGNLPLIESIFRNLIDNAIAYSGASLITIKADKDGNFTVSDNGCGIEKQHLPHIFERFYRIDKGRSRASGGTGLGLSIVQNAVILHGGNIKALCENGLTFIFNLKVNKNAT